MVSWAAPCEKAARVHDGLGANVQIHVGDPVEHGQSEREWLKDFIWPLQVIQRPTAATYTENP